MTLSLRDRLAAKQRRRVVVPIVVGEPTADETARVAAAEQAMRVAALTGDAAKAEEHRATIDEVLAPYRVDVEFQALAPHEFEAVASAYPAAEGDDGGIDRWAALPVLAAECAVDESLRDADWWREQLGSGRWSEGEWQELWRALFALNYRAPAAYVPKG